MGATWIEHKGKKILYGDYRGLQDTAQLIAVIEEEARLCKASASQVLFLDDFRDAFVSSEFIARSKVLGNEVFKERTLKAAMLGVIGIKKVFFSTYNALTGGKIKAFDDEASAKDYLVG